MATPSAKRTPAPDGQKRAVTSAKKAGARLKPAAGTKPNTKPVAKVAARPGAKALAKAPHKPKQKPVRDSFTMPKADFDLIDTLKQRAIAFRHPVKKSELLRAGLHALTKLDDAHLAAVIGRLSAIKTGRPKNSA